MDPLSQAFFGAAAAVTISKKPQLNKAFICGIIGGLAADIDVFIKAENDPLLALEFHRHFTHSLFFVPIAAILVAAFCYIFYRQNYKSLYIYSLAAYATHGFLDSCTSYGTLWLWPFYQERIAFDNISIIDPLFTLPLIILLVFSLIKANRNLAKYALIYAFCYLSLGYIQKLRVKNLITNLSAEKQHEIHGLKFNPTLGNIILWRTIYEYDQKYYINAVRQPLFGPSKIYPGPVLEKLTPAELTKNLTPNTKLAHDISRFHHFSQGFIYYYPKDKNIIADLRYGTLPNNLAALWGIKINLNQPEEHVQYLFLRDFDAKTIKDFQNMLFDSS